MLFEILQAGFLLVTGLAGTLEQGRLDPVWVKEGTVEPDTSVLGWSFEDWEVQCLPSLVISDLKALSDCLVIKSFATLCDPMDYSPPGSSVHGISQTRILEWVAISSFRDAIFISCVSCFGRKILYHWSTWEAKKFVYFLSKGYFSNRCVF